MKTTDNMRKLTQSELTKAIARYARKHGHSASFIRGSSVAKQEAIREWLNAQEVKTLVQLAKEGKL